jgi:hypothetical protein
MDEKRHRSRFQFRLRTLLIGVTLFGVLFAYGAPIVLTWQRDPATLRKNHQLGLLVGVPGGSASRQFPSSAVWRLSNSDKARKLP